MNKCPKCGQNKIMTEICVIGLPNYHVKDSRKYYCSNCDNIPILTLDSYPKVQILVKDLD